MSISSSKLLASNRDLLEKSLFWWRRVTFFYVGPEHGLSKKFASQFFTWSIYLSGDLPHGRLSYTLPSMMVSLMFPRIITHYMSKIFQNSMGYDCTQSNLHSKFVKDKNICASNCPGILSILLQHYIRIDAVMIFLIVYVSALYR